MLTHSHNLRVVSFHQWLCHIWLVHFVNIGMIKWMEECKSVYILG